MRITAESVEKIMTLIISAVIDDQTCSVCKSKNGLRAAEVDRDGVLRGLARDCLNVKAGGICRCVVQKDRIIA